MSLVYYCDIAGDGKADSGDDLLSRDLAWFLPWKALVDVLVASTLLVLTAPLILLGMLLVKATSRGPALYRQVRLGRDGRPFVLYKIRSMPHDCEKATGPQWSSGRDPRVSPLGRFLRRSHLDELPQLWNVIRRDMSLVGPRPERPEFVAKLERQVAGYRDRMNVLPGITGLAQVQLPPDEDVEDVRRKVTCDLCYIQLMSPALELKILIGTALKVVGFSYEANRRVLDLPGVAIVGQVHCLDSGPMKRSQSA